MNAVEIVPIAPEHIESFHRASILLPGSGRYLAFLDSWRVGDRSAAPVPRAGHRQALDPARTEAARAFGLNRVELAARENNTGAIELYKRAASRLKA